MSQRMFVPIAVGLVVAAPLAARASDVCYKTVTSGNATTTRMVWCATADGNLMRFESPAGAEHVRVGTLLEGYALCSPAANYWDAGLAEDGFTPGVVDTLSETTTSVTVTRSTLDGRFFVTHKFTRDNVEFDVTVTVTVKNTSGATVTDVQYSRYVDFDVDNSVGDDVFDRSADGVWARDITSTELHGATIAAISGTKHTTAVESALDLLANTRGGCTPGSEPALPSIAGDWAARVTYNLGTFSANQSKTVKFTYRRQ